MTFAQLCEEVRRAEALPSPLGSPQALGPADYISLASTFSTFFIDAVPTLFLRNKNEARRLINLIDALCGSRLISYLSTICL
jgi:predicted ATPase